MKYKILKKNTFNYNKNPCECKFSMIIKQLLLSCLLILETCKYKRHWKSQEYKMHWKSDEYKIHRKSSEYKIKMDTTSLMAIASKNKLACVINILF